MYFETDLFQKEVAANQQGYLAPVKSVPLYVIIEF